MHLLNLCFSTLSEAEDVPDHQGCKLFKDLLASLAEGKQCAGCCLQRHTHHGSPFLMRSEGLSSHVDDAFLWWTYYSGFSVLMHFIFAMGKGENTAKIYSYF